METQKTIHLPFSQIFKVEEGKISEMHLYYDLLSFRTQLGLE